MRKENFYIIQACKKVWQKFVVPYSIQQIFWFDSIVFNGEKIIASLQRINYPARVFVTK